MRHAVTHTPLSGLHLGILADVCLRDPSLWRVPSRRPSWVPNAPAMRPEVPRHYWRKDPGLWVPLSCAFSLIANAVDDGGTFATTPSRDTTGADLIALACVWFDAFAGPDVSDNKGNTWTAVVQRTEPSGITTACLFYCVNPTVGSGHTFGLTGIGAVGNFPAIAMQAWSGAAASPLDQEAGTTGSGSSITPGSVTPSENDELIISMLGEGNSAPFTAIDGGFTVSDYLDKNASFGIGMAYLVQTTATAANPTWSLLDGDLVASNTTFKLASGGGGTRRFFLA